MGYERIQKPEGLLYHYTRKENLESILRDGRIRKFCDRETWFTKSLADTLRLMSLTVMQEGAAYYDASGRLQRYPAFVPEDYVVLELTPRYQSGEWVISVSYTHLSRTGWLFWWHLPACCHREHQIFWVFLQDFRCSLQGLP